MLRINLHRFICKLRLGSRTRFHHGNGEKDVLCVRGSSAAVGNIIAKVKNVKIFAQFVNKSLEYKLQLLQWTILRQTY